VSLDATEVKIFVRGHTVEGKKCGKWSVVILEGSYGCVDSNWVFCVLGLSCMGRVTRDLEEYTGCTF
jgi:hypothetical protein